MTKEFKEAFKKAIDVTLLTHREKLAPKNLIAELEQEFNEALKEENVELLSDVLNSATCENWPKIRKGFAHKESNEFLEHVPTKNRKEYKEVFEDYFQNDADPYAKKFETGEDYYIICFCSDFHGFTTLELHLNNEKSKFIFTCKNIQKGVCYYEN